MLQNMRLWLRKKFSLERPRATSINVTWVSQTLDSRVPKALSIRLLEEVSTLAVETELPIQIYGTDPSSLSTPLVFDLLQSDVALPQIEGVNSFVDQLYFAFPEILDMFTGLVYPGGAGKAYVGHVDETGHEDEKETFTLTPDQNERCRHGLPKYMCALCTPENNTSRGWSSRRRSGKSSPSIRTVDVFQLLLPYLQPPIETLLANTELFPRDRRPYRYQVDGIRFLVEKTRALLGDEMGLGKTIQAIIALQILFRRGQIRRVLILCRRTLLSVWETELQKWAPELYVLKVRGTRQERERLWRLPAPIYLTTYETLREDVNRIANLSSKFDVVILDEVQEIKNPDTKKSRAVRRINATYRWGLSGTPLENRLEDVISIFSYLEPSLFEENLYPSADLHLASSEISDRMWAFSPDIVRDRIQPYFLRRRAKDVLKDLPGKVVNEVWLELTPNQRLTYEKEFEEAQRALRSRTVTRVHVFQRINRLKQICNIDPVSGESCKVNFLSEQLENIINSGHKALVFSHFPNVTLRRVARMLSQFDVAVFDGSLSDRERARLVRAFQEESSPKVLLMSVKTGGVGLTLTQANHVFHFDHWWNPAIARQAEGRAHRIGQRKTVFVYDIYTRNTIEEKIYNLLKQKQRLFDEVIDNLSVPGVQAAITDKELFALFDLEPPAHLRTSKSR